jgi:hypothetical protein
MLNGDISNELPRRFLVHVDAISRTTQNKETRLKIFTKTTNHVELDSAALSRLYIYTVRVGVTLELVSHYHSIDELDEVIERLNNFGTNPFRYHSVYESIDHIVQNLPYHPEVMGVLDTPTRVLMYGHWGVTFQDMFGG